MMSMHVHRVVVLLSCPHRDGIGVLVFISGSSYTIGAEPGPFLAFATKTSTDELCRHRFLKDFGDVRMGVKFIIESHL